MPQSLSRPFEIKFDGLDAEDHVVDAIYLGQSLTGTGRLYNSVTHAYFHGEVRKRPPHVVRLFVGPPRDGSLLYLIWVMLVHGTLPVYPQLLCEFADHLIPEFIRAIFSRKAGRKGEMDKSLDIIHDQFVRHDELAKMVIQNDRAEKERLLGMVEQLTTNNQSAFPEIAAPVGRTVKQIEHFAKSSEPFVIDEPIAEAFRSREDAVVGDTETLRGELLAVDKASGTCKLKQPDSEKLLRCKITDPQLGQPMNVYTHALDTGQSVEVTGKPVLKEGEVSTFYISDAKPLG